MKQHIVALMLSTTFMTLLLDSKIAQAEPSQQEAYRVNLALAEGETTVGAPSFALLSGTEGEISWSGTHGGSSYRARVTVTPLATKDQDEPRAAMVAIAMTKVNGERETPIVDSLLGVVIGSVATVEIDQAGLESARKLTVEVMNYLLPEGANARSNSCGEELAGERGGGIESSDCCGVSCGNGQLRCCGVLWCCDGVCGQCCQPP